VFHDTGNLNFTFLACKGEYNAELQTEVILRAVSSFGIDAGRSGRNDITAHGRKFSGNAFYKTGDRCCHRGTILIYGLNPEPVSDDEISGTELERLTGKFTDNGRRFGCPIKFTYEIYKRLAWGDIQIQYSVNGGKITETAVFSDAMNAGLISRIPAALKGKFFSSDILSSALGHTGCGDESESEMISDIKDLIKEQEF